VRIYSALPSGIDIWARGESLLCFREFLGMPYGAEYTSIDDLRYFWCLFDAKFYVNTRFFFCMQMSVCRDDSLLARFDDEKLDPFGGNCGSSTA
jgi:hypothetical protein